MILIGNKNKILIDDLKLLSHDLRVEFEQESISFYSDVISIPSQAKKTFNHSKSWIGVLNMPKQKLQRYFRPDQWKFPIVVSRNLF